MRGHPQADGASHAAAEKADAFSKVGASSEMADGMQQVAATVVEGGVRLPTAPRFPRSRGGRTEKKPVRDGCRPAPMRLASATCGRSSSPWQPMTSGRGG